MKKATLFAVACAMFVGAQSLAAQESNEGVTYVSDPSQGILLNRMQDNWFITAEGGANIYYAHKASHRNLRDRFAPNAGIYLGKWFTPVLGIRGGINWMQLKGLATGPDYAGTLLNEHRPGGFYKTKTNELGPVLDIMVNLTNWWCGYKPNRVYNASIYVGGLGFLTLDSDWNNESDFITGLRGGLINTFNVSNQVALSLDIRYTCLDGIQNLGGKGWNENYSDLSASIGVTYKFKNREWVAPVVPVCPPAENCDALRERLRASNDRVDQLERSLRECLDRPMPQPVVEKGDLATVYYPIGVSRLSRENQRVIAAVAAQMNSEEYAGKSFVLTGWADNNTGTDAINARLRERRAEGVKAMLIRHGVDESRLTIESNNGNRVGESDEFVSLNRAVTIAEAE